MRIGAIFGWGIVIYAILFLLWNGFVLYRFTDGYLPHILSLLTLMFVSCVAARSLRLHSWKDVLPYSIGWVLVVAVLDAIFAVPYSGWQLYTDWNLWVGYGLIATVPLVFVASHFGTRNQASIVVN